MCSELLTPFQHAMVHSAVRTLVFWRNSPAALAAKRNEIRATMDAQERAALDDCLADTLQRIRTEQARIDALPREFTIRPGASHDPTPRDPPDRGQPAAHAGLLRHPG